MAAKSVAPRRRGIRAYRLSGSDCLLHILIFTRLWVSGLDFNPLFPLTHANGEAAGSARHAEAELLWADLGLFVCLGGKAWGQGGVWKSL